MELYTENIIWFSFENFGGREKRPVVFILANETKKNNNRVYKKTLCDFWIFWVKTHPGLRYKHEKPNFACNIFFVKFIFEHKSKFATKKKD